jgi:hypothetical protein
MTCPEYQKKWILAGGSEPVPLEVREHLAVCVECRKFLQDSERLRTHLALLARSEAAPESLRRRTEMLFSAPVQKPRKPWRRWVKIAAAMLLLTLGAYGVHLYWQERSHAAERLTTEFIHDYLQYLPGREQVVSSSGQEVEDWFKGRVDFPVHVPGVPNATLEDARVCDIAGRKAALLHYRRAPDRALVAVFIAKEPKALERQQRQPAFSASMSGVSSTLWCHHGLVYDVVGALDDATLKRIAESVRKQVP